VRSFRLEALKDDPQVIIETWIKKADDISESRESFEECVGGEYVRNTKSSPQKEVGLSSVLFFLLFLRVFVLNYHRRGRRSKL